MLCLRPVAVSSLESDLRISRYDAYQPCLLVFFEVILTTKGQSTDSPVTKKNYADYWINCDSDWLRTLCLSNVAASRFRVLPVSQTNLLDGGNHFISSKLIRFLEPSQKGISIITNFRTKHVARVSLQELCHESYLLLAFEEWNNTLQYNKVDGAAF